MKKIALSLLVVAASGAYVFSQSGSAPFDDALGPAPRSGDLQTGSIEKQGPAFASMPAPERARFEPIATSGWSEDDDDDDDSEVGRLLAAQPPADESPSPSPPATIAMAVPEIAPVQQAPPLPAEDAVVAVVPAMPDPPAPPPFFIEARLPRPRPAYQAPSVSATLTRVAMNLATDARYKDGTYTGAVIDAYYGLIQIQAIVQGGQLVDINVLQYPSDRRLSVRINRYALPRLRDEAVSAQSANVDIISGATLTSEAFIRSIGTALRAAGA